MWSLDNGFEFIELFTEDISAGWTEREKDGLPRLIEAFHSQSWRSMSMKTGKRHAHTMLPLGGPMFV